MDRPAGRNDPEHRRRRACDDHACSRSIDVGTDGEQRGLLGHTVIDGVRYAAWTDPDTEHLLVGALGAAGSDGSPASIDRIVWDAGGTAGGAVGGHLVATSDGALILGIGQLTDWAKDARQRRDAADSIRSAQPIRSRSCSPTGTSIRSRSPSSTIDSGWPTMRSATTPNGSAPIDLAEGSDAHRPRRPRCDGIRSAGSIGARRDGRRHDRRLRFSRRSTASLGARPARLRRRARDRASRARSCSPTAPSSPPPPTASPPSPPDVAPLPMRSRWPPSRLPGLSATEIELGSRLRDAAPTVRSCDSPNSTTGLGHITASSRSRPRACHGPPGIGRSTPARLIQVHPLVARLPAPSTRPSSGSSPGSPRAGDGALASHRSAARLWGIPRPDDDPVDVIDARSGTQAALDGVIVHRPVDRQRLTPQRRFEIPCTNILRTLADLGAVDRPSVSAAVGHAIAVQLADLSALDATARGALATGPARNPGAPRRHRRLGDRRQTGRFRPRDGDGQTDPTTSSGTGGIPPGDRGTRGRLPRDRHAGDPRVRRMGASRSRPLRVRTRP